MLLAGAADSRGQGSDVNGVGWDILFVLAIIAIGGFFAAAEMAFISLREGQIRTLANRGKRGQRTARLAHDPNTFLSAVQIGVTVATLLTGAIGAATLAGHLRRPERLGGRCTTARILRRVRQ